MVLVRGVSHVAILLCRFAPLNGSVTGDNKNAQGLLPAHKPLHMLLLDARALSAPL